MSGIKKEIDLSGLPRKGKLINWKSSIGYNCEFVYDDIEGEVEIVGYDCNKKPIIIFKYKHEIYKMKSDNFSRCNFGKMLSKFTYDFKIDMGAKFKDKKRSITIIDREYRKNKNGNKYKFYKYTCNKCGYSEGWIEESHLLNNRGCSCCNGSIVVPGINDIPTTAPWMVKYFQGGEEEAKLYTKGSEKRIHTICPDCGKVKSKTIRIVDLFKKKSIGCICNDKVSYSEKLMFHVLKQLNIEFIFQLTKNDLSWCNDYRYDFYINCYNTIIEVHGIQHYKYTGFKRTLKEEIDNDMLKRELALKNKINKYIVIDCRESEVEYIKNSILNSELSKIYDLSKIDWDKADEFATSNLVKTVCEYYENNLEITQKEISELFKLGKNAVGRYLKQGEKVGWCSNVDKRGRSSNIKSCIKSNSKKVLCIELNEEFKSATECAKILTKRYDKQFDVQNISCVCRGKRKYHQGFTFKYV